MSHVYIKSLEGNIYYKVQVKDNTNEVEMVTQTVVTPCPTHGGHFNMQFIQKEDGVQNIFGEPISQKHYEGIMNRAISYIDIYHHKLPSLN